MHIADILGRIFLSTIFLIEGFRKLFFREQKWFGPSLSRAFQKKMNWDQAAEVIPDLLKIELVRSDDRFSTGIPGEG